MIGIKAIFNKCLHQSQGWGGILINGSVMLLIIISIATLPLNFLALPETNIIAQNIHKFIVSVFTVEYILRVWSANFPFRYMFSIWGIIDILAVAPMYFIVLFDIDSNVTKYLSICTALRAFRIGKLATFSNKDEQAMINRITSTLKHGALHIIPGEKICRIVQRDVIFFLVRLIFPILILTAIISGVFLLLETGVPLIGWIGLLLVFLMTIVLILIIKAWIDFALDLLYITDRRLVIQNRELFGTIINDITYAAITNVKPDNVGIIEWIFCYGSIIIETASSEGKMSFHYIPAVHEVVAVITKNREKITPHHRGEHHTISTSSQ